VEPTIACEGSNNREHVSFTTRLAWWPWSRRKKGTDKSLPGDGDSSRWSWSWRRSSIQESSRSDSIRAHGTMATHTVPPPFRNSSLSSEVAIPEWLTPLSYSCFHIEESASDGTCLSATRTFLTPGPVAEAQRPPKASERKPSTSPYSQTLGRRPVQPSQRASPSSGRTAPLHAPATGPASRRLAAGAPKVGNTRAKAGAGKARKVPPITPNSACAGIEKKEHMSYDELMQADSMPQTSPEADFDIEART
jgi:hypothetical protein